MTTKIAYLTIDDSPTKTMAQKMDFLLSKEIPAVWFCQGNWLEKRPFLAIQAIQQGFIIGNHAYDHPHFSDLTVDDCIHQIKRTDAQIEALYKKAGVPQPTKCFRFPFGDKGALTYSNAFAPLSEEGAERKAAIQTALRQLGYSQPQWTDITYPYFFELGLQDDVDWYWTYDVMEWSIFAEMPHGGIDSIEAVFERMDRDEPEAFCGLNSGDSAEIVLTHDHVATAVYFQPIIERLLSKGLQFALPNF